MLHPGHGKRRAQVNLMHLYNNVAGLRQNRGGGAAFQRIPSLRRTRSAGLLVEHDLFRKPVPIPDRNRGRLFRDHAR
jgi:hypothetical protein